MPDAFLCDAIRTPVGRYGGALSSVRADDLGAIPLKALAERNPEVDWEQLDDAVMGCANQAGAAAGRLPGRLPRHHRQPPLRLGHGRGGHRRPGHQGRRG
jgi:acetyl-CoA acetyltransferase